MISGLFKAGWVVNGVFFSDDNEQLVGVSTANLVTEIGYQTRMWEIRSQKVITEGIKLYHDGQNLIINYQDDNKKMWPIATIVNEPVAQRSPIPEVPALSLDGRWRAKGWGSFRNQSGGVFISDVATDQDVAQIPNEIHKGPVIEVVFMPDRESLITLTSWGKSDDETGSVRMWNIETGRKVMNLSHDNVIDMALSPNGRWLATASRNGTTRLLLLQSEDLIAEACTRLTRNLTRLEWRQAFGDAPYRATCPNLPLFEEK